MPLQDLEDKRDKMIAQHEAKLSKLEAKITTLRSRHQDRIEVDQIVNTMSPDEIRAAEMELKARLSAMKKAGKLKATK